MHGVFFMANHISLLVMFLKVDEIYTVNWLQNYMLLSWGAIGLALNGLWIKLNFSIIKKRWIDGRYYVGKLSILTFFLLNLMLPAALHSINERFGVTETTTVYGKLVDVKMRKKKKSSKFYPEGTFHIDEQGYNGFVYKSVSGYKDVSSLLMKVVVKKGFFGWEWLDEQAIVEIE